MEGPEASVITWVFKVKIVKGFDTVKTFDSSQIDQHMRMIIACYGKLPSSKK